VSMGELIYLDYNATTPVDPRVLERMTIFLKEKWGNPSSNHPIGWYAWEALDIARAQVANLIGCDKSEILFTSGGTESNNLAILGIAGSHQKPGRIITTTIEHPATDEPCAHLERNGWTVTRVPVDSLCRVSIDEMREEISKGAHLVTIMHSNNETGSLQPVSEISGAARDRGIPVHTDAAQSLGKVPVKVDELGVDLLSIAGHKLYAPKGVGALFIRAGVELTPVLRGAGQEKGLKPGTENVAGIAALGEACAIAEENVISQATKMQKLRDDLLGRMAAAIPDIRVNGHEDERLPNTLNVIFPGIRGSLLLAKCDEIAASTGAACHEGGKEVPSKVLSAMGIPAEEALGAVRLTLGRYTTAEQIALAAQILIREFLKLENR
jgi:cysteine desulfurase